MKICRDHKHPTQYGKGTYIELNDDELACRAGARRARQGRRKQGGMLMLETLHDTAVAKIDHILAKYRADRQAANVRAIVP